MASCTKHFTPLKYPADTKLPYLSVSLFLSLCPSISLFLSLCLINLDILFYKVDVSMQYIISSNTCAHTHHTTTHATHTHTTHATSVSQHSTFYDKWRLKSSAGVATATFDRTAAVSKQSLCYL